MKKYILLTLLVTIFFSCKNQEKEALERTFSQAGDNKKELQKVLDHYSEPKDSLKKQAAIFLIKNMSAHFFLESEELNRYNQVFDSLNIRSTKHINYKSIDYLTIIADSIGKIYGKPSFQNLRQNFDSKTVSANFLIQNIDFAFRAWKKNPWSKNIDFKRFCEYILPYRLNMEPIENWRPSFYDIFTDLGNHAPNTKDSMEVYHFLQKELSKYVVLVTRLEQEYSYPISISNLQKAGMGSCIQAGLFRTMALRSIGLPTTIDFTPEWGNYSANHSMVKLITDEKPAKFITNDNIAEDLNPIFEFATFFEKDKPKISPGDFPEEVTVNYTRLLPKVYRYMWSIQPQRLEILENALAKEIAPGFNLFEKDVTDEYLVCENITVHINGDPSKHRIAYLSIFKDRSWAPVTSTVINEKGYACFKNMGRLTIYIPTVYENSEMIPAGKPFYFDAKGKIVNIKASKQNVHEIKLISKYPFFANMAYRSFDLKGVYLEGANKADFSDADSLFGITNLPFYYQEAKVKNSKTFRYYRIVAPENKKCCLAELKFFGIEKGDTVQLSGHLFNSKEADSTTLQKIQDNNLETFYESESGKLNWIGIDLGKNTRKKVIKMGFCPRNDANCIIPGNEYELFYWDKEWLSLGIQKANRRSLTYKNIPVGVLLWLRCHTEGKEERIFLYENNKQVWF
ncbi:MAG: hypothetical protein PHS30_01800 [Bacteroidales bacterium]|nr:hypothetical protein [Bacteroidales bacterium]